MTSFYNKLCEKFINIYICLATFFGYNICSKNTKASSFVINNIDIEIIDTNIDIDHNNLTKYLKHHIMFTDDNFHPMFFFDEPLMIRFKYQNETYRICLKQLLAKNIDHSISIKQPRYLSAIIKQNNNEPIYITDILIEFHGPDKNFFSHIPDAITDLSILLKCHKGSKLHTFDMLGNQEFHDLE